MEVPLLSSYAEKLRRIPRSLVQSGIISRKPIILPDVTSGGFPEQDFFIVLLGKNGKDFFMPIYTRSGDKGKTSLLGGKKILKSDPKIEVLGEVDELNSLIGVIVSKIGNKNIKAELMKIQKDLFEVNSISINTKHFRERVSEFEKLIDEMSKNLPEIHNFILPGGGENGSFLHLARAVSRKVERKIVALSKKQKINLEILKYFNRLSDMLFTMARFVNQKEKRKEIVWKND